MVYRDSANGFAISYPQSWDIMPEWQWGEALVGFWYTLAVGSAAHFQVFREELTYPMDVEAYFEAVKRQLASRKEYTDISEQELTLGGRAAMKHVFTWQSEQSQKDMVVCLVDGTTAWIIYCGTLTDLWSQFAAKFDAIAGSFRLD